MGEKKKLKQKQREERFPYLMAMYACLGIVGLSSHIATKVESWSFAYWISIGVIVIFGTTLLTLLSRMLRLDEEQEKRLK